MSATFVSRFGGKTAGQLIRADDWNDLVAAIDTLATGLTTDLNTLETETDTRLDADEAQLAAAKTQLDTMATTVTELEGEVTALTQLLGQYFRVNLSTSRVGYVAGEQATIVAQLRDLRDQPVTFTDAQRPWIDFVTVWGQLAAAPGFQSIGGDGASGDDRVLSVRVNSTGQAQVLVRAEIGADLAADVHADMAAALTTKLSPKSVAETILGSATPQEAKSSGAFAAIASMYDKKSASGVRAYADKYYVDKSATIVGKVAPPIVGHFWRDYRSTVLAFVRADSDPTTPDQGRGVSTIQLTFRDWIGPWIVTHYLDDLEIAKDVPLVRNKLQPKFTNDYFDSVVRVKAEIDGIVGGNGRGLIGRIKDFEVVHNALDGITVSQPAALVDKVTQTVQQAVALQQAFEPAQATTFVGRGQVALNAVTDPSVAANGDVTAVKGQVAAIQSKVDQVGGKVEDQGKTITALDTKVTQTSSAVQTIDNRVGDVNTKVNKVQALYPVEVRNQFLEVREAVLDVKSIKDHLNLP